VGLVCGLTVLRRVDTAVGVDVVDLVVDVDVVIEVVIEVVVVDVEVVVVDGLLTTILTVPVVLAPDPRLPIKT